MTGCRRAVPDVVGAGGYAQNEQARERGQDGGMEAFAARGAMAQQEARVLYWTRVNPYNTPRAKRTKVL